MESTLVQICHTRLMEGIGASLEETHELTLNYEVINCEVFVSVLEGTGILMPDLKCMILSHKDNIMDLQRLKNPDVPYTVTWE